MMTTTIVHQTSTTPRKPRRTAYQIAGLAALLGATAVLLPATAAALAARGKPSLELISQDSYVPSAKTRTLATGAVWVARGVTCKVAVKTVTCTNGSHHGFTIGNRRYKSF